MMRKQEHASEFSFEIDPSALVRVLRSVEGWFSFPVVAAALFACMVYLWIPVSVADPDIWWHLRNVETQLTNHAFLTHDLYSFTAHGSLWINHEWLAEIPFYLGWRASGERGLFLVTVAAIEMTLLGVFYLSYKKSGSIAATMVVSVLAAFAATVSFGPRTLLFGWICLVLELAIFEYIPARPWCVWMLPVLFLFWVNLHGSWVIGVVVMLIFAACTQVSATMGGIEAVAWPWTRTKPLMISGFISLAALFVNPYGWRLVAYPFDLAFRQKLNIGTIDEWKSLDFHSVRGKVFLGTIGLLFMLQLLKNARWSLYELALVFIGVYAAVTYSRFLFLGGILIMPVLARHLFQPVHTSTTRYRGWMGAALLAAMLPSIYKHVPSSSSPDVRGSARPSGALTYLRRLPQGARVFNEFSWGGFLEWNLRQLPVFIDSRVDIFEYNGTFRDYLDIVQIKDSLGILDRHKIRYVVFRQRTPLTYLLGHDTAWQVDYQDEVAVVFERIGYAGSGETAAVRSTHP